MRYCENCDTYWHYTIDTCIMCRKPTIESSEDNLTVVGLTQTMIPSPENADVPYFSLLLKDSNGNLFLRKTKKNYKIGETFGEEKRDIKRTVGVIGTGVMGTGLVQLCAEAGIDVVWKSRTNRALDDGIKKMDASISRFYDEKSKRAVLERIKTTTDMRDLSNADIVIECVTEDMKIKTDILRHIENTCKNSIIATNTSSLPVNRLADSVRNKEKFIGLHFFNPVGKTKLVEVVSGKETSRETIMKCLDFSLDLGKTPIALNDSPLFIVNRILFPYLIEAVKLLMDDVATAEDIDKAAKLGLNYPIGPIALIDLIGLDTFLNIIKNTGNKNVIDYIEKMVDSGKLGRKSGEGFYKYK